VLLAVGVKVCDVDSVLVALLDVDTVALCDLLPVIVRLLEVDSVADSAAEALVDHVSWAVIDGEDEPVVVMVGDAVWVTVKDVLGLWDAVGRSDSDDVAVEVADKLRSFVKVIVSDNVRDSVLDAVSELVRERELLTALDVDAVLVPVTDRDSDFV